ncbi:hypothetical protein TNCV_1558551 [Trichonephila clavipes]|uniref:Uncharacterized protein n=1 Tax=Trichonephila clavipes TaxID=2585209 RepID=A0A8X6R779_TRICX|nr:hypothetical protein TNCV_1558551 [Trichonephila clavipes]
MNNLNRDAACNFLQKLGIVQPVEINTYSSHVILCVHAQSGCGISSQATVGGTERAPSRSCTGPTGHYPVFMRRLAISENENAIERILSSEYILEKAER